MNWEYECECGTRFTVYYGSGVIPPRRMWGHPALDHKCCAVLLDDIGK